MFQKVEKLIRQGRRSKPVKNYLVIYIFAGHGVMKDGEHCLLTNEYDKMARFYRMVPVENSIKNLA